MYLKRPVVIVEAGLERCCTEEKALMCLAGRREFEKAEVTLVKVLADLIQVCSVR